MAVLLTLLAGGCNQFNLVDTLGTAGEGGELLLEPSTANVVKNGTLSFVATGGDQPYTFQIVSGLGSINSSTGVYTAPSTVPGSDVSIRVVDDAGTTKTATVTITGSAGSFALSPAGTVTVSPGGQVNFVAGGGSGSYTFSLTATGSGSPTIDSSTGVYVAGSNLGANLDTVEVSDGVNPAVSTTISIASATTDVDYDIGGLAFPAGGTADQPLSAIAAFDITNNGTSNGAEPVYWHVYLSQDGTLGSGDYLVDEGTIAGLAVGATTTPAIDVTGRWPSFTGGATFFVRVFAQDDFVSGVNQASATTTINAPDVDYEPTGVSVASGFTVGGAFSGSFDLSNFGANDGSKTVYWSAFISSNGTSNPDTGELVDTGTASALGAGGTNSNIPIGGTWTLDATNLFVQVTAQDDVNASNDIASSPVSLTPPPVDYDVTGVTHSSGTASGGSFSGSFSFQNVGSAAGSQPVYWTAYVSQDSSLDASDIPVDTGSAVALASSGSDSAPFTGTWPATPVPPTTFYLIVELTNQEDIVSGNDVQAAGAVSVVHGDIRNEASMVGPDPGTYIINEPFTGSFTISNLGTDPGLRDISWSVYASDDSIFDAGDPVVDSGTIGPLGAGGSTPVNFAGYWPNTPGITYRLFAQISSVDPVTAPLSTSAEFAVLASGADYRPSNVSIGAAGANPGEALTGSFDIDNTLGTQSGTQTVNFEVYASKDTTLGTGDALVATGSTGPLSSGGGPVSVPFSGTTPIKYGTYYLLVRVIAGDDINSANDTVAGTGTFTVGVYNEIPTEPNNDFVSFTDAFDLGITFEPGMQVQVVGDVLDSVEPWDIICFNTGTAARLRFTWSSDVATDLDLYIYDDTGAEMYSDITIRDITTLFAVWEVDANNAQRYVDLTNASSGPFVGINSYSLIITAE